MMEEKFKKIRLERALAYNEMQARLREEMGITEEEFVIAIAVAADSAKAVWPEEWDFVNKKLISLIPRVDA